MFEQGFHRLMLGADDVEIAQQYIICRFVIRSPGEEFSDRLNFRDPLLELRTRCAAEIDVDRADHKFEPPRLKGDHEWRPGKLLFAADEPALR